MWVNARSVGSEIRERRSIRRARAQGLVVLTAALFAATLSASPALAAKSIGGFIGGQPVVPKAGFFTQPRDVAIYTGGDADRTDDKIFVVATHDSHHVQRLDADGNAELVFGGDVIVGGAPGDLGEGYEICDVAVSGRDGCQPGRAGTAAGLLDVPTGIAVNQASGDVYVLDRDNARVQQFDLDGHFVRAWGWGVDTGADAFEICTGACEAGITGSGVGQLGSTGATGLGIAVAPPSGDVLVADPANGRVLRFGSDGTSPDDVGAGTFSSGHPQALAVDADDFLYASDGGQVNRYDVSASPATLDPLPDALLGAGTTFGMEVDPATGRLLVGRQPSSGSPVVREIADPSAPLSPGGPPNPAVADTHVFATEDAPTVVNGLGHDPVTGNLYLAVALYQDEGTPFSGCENEPGFPGGAGECHGLIVLADVGTPVSVLDDPLAVGTSSAEVSGSVDPAGGVARYVFELSLDGVSWTPAVPVRHVSGSAPVSVAAELSGLDPNSSYMLRLRVFKQVGMDDIATALSAEKPFMTDPKEPVVQTLGSATRRATSAVLRARIDPEGAATTYRFEYGRVGEPFEDSVPVPDASAGSGNTPQLFVHQVGDLAPDVAYQYRVVAENFVGPATGQTVTFRTLPDGDPPPKLDARGLELVSPPDKVGGQGLGAWYVGPGSHEGAGVGSYDGERYASKSHLGGILLDSGYGYATDWALAERSPSGWVNAPAMNRQAHGRQSSRMVALATAGPDLSLMTWRSNGGLLRLFPELRDWPDMDAVFLRDWAGKWEALGPTAPGQVISNAFESHVVLDDESGVVASTRMRGLAGPDDPAFDAVPDVSNVYMDDVSAGLSNTFPGSGLRAVVNLCASGTEVPARDPSGDLSARACAAGQLVDARGASIGLDDRAVSRTASSDGSRIFFMAPDAGIPSHSEPCSGTDATTACPPQLFVRERAGTGFVTRWIGRSEIPGQDASLLAPVSFEGASSDGDKVFLRTASPLTADDPNGGAAVPGGVKVGVADPFSVDLFMYDFPDDPSADPGDGELTRISAGPEGSDANVSRDARPPFSGGLRFLSEDGSRAYFVTAAPLAGVPTSGSGTVADPGGTRGSVDASNLYAYDASQPLAQRWRFVARLPRSSALGNCAASGADSGTSITSNLAGSQLTKANCFRGTADGAFVTFWTDGRLTGDDPDSTSGDVYGYVAERDELTRLSATQGGVGGLYQCTPEGASAALCNGDGGFGSSGRVGQHLGVATDPEREGDRLAFFQSRSRLVEEDLDDAYDVYQWHNGDLSLISTGASDGDGAFYQGNDRSGRTVFVSTLDRLSWQDRDAVMDVYAARIGGGIPEPPAPPVCAVLTGACQGGGVAQLPWQVDSADAGQGNARPSPRTTLTVAGLSRRAARRASARGVLSLRVRGSIPGRVSALARARIAGKARTVGKGSVVLRRAGTAVVRIRLSRVARRRLARQGRLGVVVRAQLPGTAGDSIRITLREAMPR
jgi:hypothetical protein